MSRASIFRFPSVAMSVTPKQLAVLVEYLVLNTDVFLDDAQTTALFKSRTIVSTPISRIFQRMQDIGGQGVFSPFRFRTGVHTINEIASLRHVTFDMDQAADVVTAPVAGAIASQPTISDHILLNVTQYTRASGELTDSIGFQSAVVRDLLSRSFFEDQRTTWMTPNLTQFVCKVYSMTLGSSVAKWYNLDYKSQSLVTALFAYFYLSLMSNPTVAVNTLKTKWRYFYLPEADDLDQVFALVHATLGKESLDSLEDVFATINALGIERIRLNRQILTTRLKTLGPDIMTSGIALEYPPYFTYLILLVLSGSKIGLSYQIKGFGMIKEASAFVEDLIQTTNFAGSLTSSPGVWI